MKNIYCIEPTDSGWSEFDGWDIYIGFVVVADSEQEAREFCSNCVYYDRDRRLWFDEKITKCTFIGSNADREESGVILDSYKAG